MQYKLYLNLQQRALLRIATSFWERKTVKDKAAEFFRYSDEFETSEVECKWDEFTKTIVKEWNKDVLPQKLEAELIHIVKMIGKTIFKWYRYIKIEYNEQEEAINCIDEIEWTPYGTVDAVKICKSSWLNNPNVDIAKVYKFACRYAMEEHINDLWDKTPVEMKYFYNTECYRRCDRHILAYWKHCRDSILYILNFCLLSSSGDVNTQDIRLRNFLYSKNRSTEENMLRLSVHQGCFIATKYFWERLTGEDRDENVLKCALISVFNYMSYDYQDESIEDYRKSQYVEICIFLMNQMSDGQKKVFFNEQLELCDFGRHDSVDIKDEILKMILSTWPWQELFIPVLKDMIQYQDDDSQMNCVFLEAITGKMVENYDLGYSIETDKYRCLLREAWLIIPKSFKWYILHHPHFQFVYNLVRVSDLDTLKLILNDPDIADVRNEFIYLGIHLFSPLIAEDRFDKLEKFIEEIFESEPEKIEFRQLINAWDLLINEGKFHLADKLLDWQSSTPEERQSLKNHINHIAICESLFDSSKYDLANDFLDWKFNTEEEKRKCKDHFKNNTFSIKHICEIWVENSSDINSAVDKCSRFSHWFLESEEEIALFKKGIIVNFKCNESNIFHFNSLKRDGVADIFISWCLLDDEHFQHTQRMNQALVWSNKKSV